LTGDETGFRDVDGTWLAAEEMLIDPNGVIPRVVAVEPPRRDPNILEVWLTRILWLDRELLDVERDGIRAKSGKRQLGGKSFLGEQLRRDRSLNIQALAKRTGSDKRV
jgi:hypothetical protein